MSTGHAMDINRIERKTLRQELRQRRIELDRLEEAVARQGAVFDPAQMAALRGLRSKAAELRSALAGVEARGTARPTSVLYGVPSNPYFVDRADEMRDTVRALEERQVVVVWGTAGIGKSALAIEIAHRHSWRWPGGVLWLSCQGGPAFETLLTQMGAFCGQDLSQADPARNPERVRRLLASLEDCLLIWDSYEDIEGDNDVRRFLVRLPSSCRALLTSRVDPDVWGWRTVPLGGLADEDMHELFTAMVVDKNVQIATEEDFEAIPALIEFLEGHPLALSLFVPLAAGRCLSKVWAELRASLLGGVEMSFALSYDALGSPLKKLFTRLSVFTIPFEKEATESVGQIEDAVGCLEELVRRSLLYYDGARYGYQILVRPYAYARLCEREDPRAVHRLAAQYLNTKFKGEGGTPQEALEECDQWEKAEAWEEFAKNSSALVGSLDRMGYWPEIMERLERAREAVREHLDDAKLEARLLHDKATIALKRAEWDEARSLWREAAALFETSGDESGAATAWGNVGHVLSSKGDWDEAIRAFNKARDAFERAGDNRNLAAAYNNLGLVYAKRGEWRTAIEYYQKALAISEKLGDIHGMAQTHNNLGLVYTDKGEWDRAIEFYQKALDTKDKLGDIHGMAQTYNNLGLVYTDKGEWDRAIEFYQKALATLEKLGDIHGMAQTYNNLGAVYLQKGEWDRTIEFYQKSFGIKEKLGDIHGMAQTYNNLGEVYRMKGEWDRAIEFYQKSLDIKEKLGDVHGMAPTYTNLGSVYLQKGEEDKALELYHSALTTFQELGDVLNMAKVFGNLGTFYEQRGDTDRAAQYITQAYFIFTQMGARPMVGQAGGHLAHLLGSAENAQEYVEEFWRQQEKEA